MELTNLSILIYVVFFAPAVIGAYLFLKKGEGVHFLVLGILITVSLFVFRPVKFSDDPVKSEAIYQSFESERPAQGPADFEKSVDQRYTAEDRKEKNESALKDFKEYSEK